MARKRRKENIGLPTRWRFSHNAYYYQVPKGLESMWNNKKLFRLGTSLPEAYRIWADRMNANKHVNSLTQLLERYALEIIPTKTKITQTGYKRCLKPLLEVFGTMRLDQIKPMHIYQYVDKRSKKVGDLSGRLTGGLTQARQEIAVLSSAFTYAVKWGYIDRHPFKSEVKLERPKPRTRYVTDDEIAQVLALQSTMATGSVKAIQCYIKVKLLTGMARGDLLRLTLDHLREDGIHIIRHKTQHSTGKQTIYEWSDVLRAAIDEAKLARPTQYSNYLFCTRRGKPYFDENTEYASGWDSMWQRFMKRILVETTIKERFTEHDLRAKCASDAGSLDQARALLSHIDSKTTSKVYRRKPERVKPLR